MRTEGVCLDCGDGLAEDGAGGGVEVLGVLAAWLSAAGTVVTDLGRTPMDPRYTVALRKLERRGRVYRRVLAALTALPVAPGQRYPFDVRWARERGVLEVRDCWSGAWLALDAAQAPDHWRWRATGAARAVRALRSVS